jgi:hypothetical protein
MPLTHYTVRCSFVRPEDLERFLSWLKDRHVADVCAAGADDADIVRLDPERGGAPYTIELRYRFASREAFARYERDEAPRLRAEGLAEASRLGVAVGTDLVMTRSTGEGVAWRTKTSTSST